MASPKRAIINLTDEQSDKLEAAAKRGGYPSIPAYVKIKALEAAEEK